MKKLLTMIVLTAAAQPALAITTFGPARPITSLATLDICETTYCQNDRKPGVAADGNGVVVVAWNTLVDLSGNNTESPRIVFVRSTDGGQSWTDPAYLDVFAALPNSSYYPTRVVEDGQGNWIVSWRSNTAPFTAVVRSIDGGQTWASSAPGALAGTSAALQADRATGTILLVQDQDPLPIVHRSIDGGASWTSAPGPDDLDDGPALVGDGAGNWMMSRAFSNEASIATSIDDGVTWTAFSVAFDEIPGGVSSLATDGDGTWFLATATTYQSPSLLAVATSINLGSIWSEPVLLAFGNSWDDSPIALLAKGQGRVEIHAPGPGEFLDGGGNDVDLLTIWSDDDGATWSRARAMVGAARGTDPYGDGGDFNLEIVPSGDSYIAVWTSTETLRFKLGYGIDLSTDWDILVAVGSDRCASEPRAGCRRSVVADSASLKIKQTSNGAQRLKWLWKKGAATPLEDFGDPTSDTDYTLCIYETVAGVPRLIAEQHMDPDGICRNEACWQARTTKGFFYGDGAFISGAVRGASLAAGEEGRAQMSLQASGGSLGLPSLPLLSATGARVQMVNERDDLCWESVFDSLATNSATGLSARGD